MHKSELLTAKVPLSATKEAAKSNSGICRPISPRMTFPRVENSKLFSAKLYYRENCIYHQHLYNMNSSAVDLIEAL